MFVLRGSLGFRRTAGYVRLQYRLWHCRPKADDVVCSGGCVFVQGELQRQWPNRVPLTWVVVRGVEVDALLSGPALVDQDGVRDGGAAVVSTGWSGLEQSSNVVRTVVASAPMSPSGTTSSHVVRDLATLWARVSLQDLRFVLGPVLQHAFHVRSLRVRLDTVLR